MFTAPPLRQSALPTLPTLSALPSLSTSSNARIERGSPSLVDVPPTPPVRFELVSRLRRQIFFNGYTDDDKIDVVIDRLVDDLLGED